MFLQNPQILQSVRIEQHIFSPFSNDSELLAVRRKFKKGDAAALRQSRLFDPTGEVNVPHAELARFVFSGKEAVIRGQAKDFEIQQRRVELAGGRDLVF